MSSLVQFNRYIFCIFFLLFLSACSGVGAYLSGENPFDPPQRGTFYLYNSVDTPITGIMGTSCGIDHWVALTFRGVEPGETFDMPFQGCIKMQFIFQDGESVKHVVKMRKGGIGLIVERQEGVGLVARRTDVNELRLLAGECLECLRKMVASGQGESVNKAVKNPELLINMSKRGYAESVAWLLDQGADPNGQNVLGETALFHANPKIAALLVNAGASVDVRSTSGLTPFLYAAQDSGQGVDKLRYLLEQGADINGKTPNGRSALILAVKSESAPGKVEGLLELGADLYATDDRQWSAIHYAARLQDPALLTTLLRHSGPQGVTLTAGDRDIQPLAFAARKDSLGNVELLLKAGADPNHGDSGDVTSLHEAIAASADPAIVKALINAGAEPNVQNAIGITPLHLAVVFNQPRLAELLLQFGADVNLTNDVGDTPLHRASREQNAELQALLVQAGANPTLVNRKGESPQSLISANRREIEQRIEAEKIAFREKQRELARERELAAKRERERQENARIMGVLAGAVLGAVAVNNGADSATGQNIVELTSATVDSFVTGDPAALNAFNAKMENLNRQLEQQKAMEARLMDTMAQEREQQQRAAVAAQCSPAKPNALAPMKNQCGLDKQSDTLCKTADLYYNRYLEMCREGRQDPTQMYRSHVAAAEHAMRFMKDYQKTMVVETSPKRESSQSEESSKALDRAVPDPAVKTLEFEDACYSWREECTPGDHEGHTPSGAAQN